MNSIAASQPGSQSPLHDANTKQLQTGLLGQNFLRLTASQLESQTSESGPLQRRRHSQNFFFALQFSRSKAVVAAIKSMHSSLLQHSAGLSQFQHQV
ncbi:hypothetical protein WJX77_004957 [Trebouxia sp. C0004]